MATDKLVDFDHVTDYISREAALACFSDWIDRYGHEHTADEMAEYQRIEALPEENVRPVVHGRWEIMSDPRFRRCSVCHDKVVFNMKNLPNFCDVCGADMQKPNLDTTKGERRDESNG